MEKLTFDDWWVDFSTQFRGVKDGGYTMLERLVSEISTFSQQKKLNFIDELLERKNLEVFACKLIPLFGDQKQINEIKKRANELVEIDVSKDILPTYFEAILNTYSSTDLPLLTKYFLNKQEYFSFKIPIKLFEVEKDLFLKSFSGKLSACSVESICEFDNLLYLTQSVQAIGFLINELPDELSLKMKLFARAKSNHPCVINDKELTKQLLVLAETVR